MSEHGTVLESLRDVLGNMDVSPCSVGKSPPARGC